MSLLAALKNGGALRTLDHALAQSLRRLRPDTPDTVLAAAALASLAVSQGHAGLDPRQPQRLVEADTAWPDADTWLDQLRESPWVDVPDADSVPATEVPLVLENGLLYLRRYREYERRLADGLQRIATHPPGQVDPAVLASLFAQLFPQAREGIDHQARAAGVALRHPLVLVTGGPGTGKTTIIDGLTAQGYCCYPEISREVTLEAKKQGIEQLFLENPLLFSELLLEGRKKQFLNAQQEPHEIVFLDRGIPDVLAYMHYIGDSYPAHFDHACRENLYSRIFILPPWEEIYTSDDERYENYEQAKLIFDHLTETYRNYGYDLIPVPKDTVENRIAFILENLKSKNESPVSKV